MGYPHFIAGVSGSRLSIMKATSLFLSVLFLTAMAPLSFANASDVFQRRVEDVQTRCPRLNCPAENIWVVTFPASEQKKLTKDEKTTMKNEILQLVGDMWPSSILQSTLKNSNRLRIDKIEKLVVEGKHAGYRVSYSDKAWELNTCQYDANNPDSLKDCKTGRIFESAFMSLDFAETFPDAQALATFHRDGETSHK